MSEELEQKSPLEECAAQMGSAAQALERVIGKLEAQYEALNQKIDRIIATVEKPEKEAGEVKASASEGRRTLAPLVHMLLAKSGVGEGSVCESGVLDKALSGLAVEQRIAVKSELARAGMIG